MDRARKDIFRPRNEEEVENDTKATSHAWKERGVAKGPQTPVKRQVS